jgi:ATP-dependent Lhr-like helicase
LTRRATARLADLRERSRHLVDADRTVLVREEQQARWWTWAGGRGNTLIAAALARVAPGLVDESDRFDNRYLRLRGEVTGRDLTAALDAARRQFGDDLRGVQPDVDEDAVRQLKFAELLPPDLARLTLAARLSDHETAARVIGQGILTLQR